MDININLNNEKYRYDVYHMVNVFYPDAVISFVEKNENMMVLLENNKIYIKKAELKKQFHFQDELSIKDFVKKSMYLFLSEITGLQHPWGIMIGIRPTKIAQTLIDEGYNDEQIINYYEKYYLVRHDKAELSLSVAKAEKKFINKDTKIISIYVGMPFCPTRCAYCSFASNPIAGNDKLVKQYLEKLNYEIEQIAEYLDEKRLNVECVYFGGGTPTSVCDADFEYIMKSVYNKLVEGRNVKEFTVEAGRPDSITENKLKTMKRYKVDRISINPQSMNDDTLSRIGRKHFTKDVIDKFNLARRLGFDNINMDIIVGLPGEGLAEIKNTCNELKVLSPESITVHGMAIKRASKLHEINMNSNYFSKLNSEELNAMYEETKIAAKELKLHPYYMYRQKNMVGSMENVGFCKPGFEGIYNIEMMEERQTVIALGAGAVSKIYFSEENRLERYPNLKDVREYVNRTEELVQGKLKILNTLYV
ncbi:coproporphyrinogen III oxidase [Clostridium oryzae]|uniref:Oxygen-independent coproporphyrinogen-III oxidase-like protein HemZ n=1 Tax=Clostridium oryzae TaxID=1450648 RepID=A0A1V4IUJ6_9CLOT|nr:coproporphyrinogen III oxidase [Clostridium oryzae]OPJ63589.1 oxygen-independent coproporphyrinogen-III oxidase-like protein HemZ [Clostridium oryzae]